MRFIAPNSRFREAGLNGLIRLDGSGVRNTNNWQYHGKVMVWSAGPDGKIDQQTGPANHGANKDNVLSWK